MDDPAGLQQLDDIPGYLGSQDREALLAHLKAAIASGLRYHLVDLDAAVSLDWEGVAVLIKALRLVRERGGDLWLVTSRRDIREVLVDANLQAVFRIFGSRDEARALFRRIAQKSGVRAYGQRRWQRIVRGFVASAALLFALTRAGAAQPEPDAAAIVAAITAANQNLETYQAHIHVKVHMTSFPFLATTLEGQTYFKRPDNYEVVFSHVPSYAKGFERVYADIGDPSAWNKRYFITVEGVRDVDGHRDLVLRLVQRVRGMIDHELVMVDDSSQRIDAMEWHYYNGGVITMSQRFRIDHGMPLIVAQRATIAIPYVRAVAVATYDDYRTNIALADSLFSKPH